MENGQARAYVLVRADAGEWEKRAAQDLSATVAKMTGATLPVVHQKQAGIPIVVGQLAATRLAPRLQAVAKKNWVLRADAIALECSSEGIYLAGSNDDSHYFAAAELMRRWGCRWYLPTDFGECLPHQTTLAQGPLNYAYAPPFEVRGYWISWNGDTTGYPEFAHRNFMNCERVPSGHAIGPYVEQISKKLGKFEVSSPAAATAMADLVAADYAAGKSFSLSMEDASVASTSDQDKDLAGRLRDKYFGTEVLSDAYLTFYNRVCEQLVKRYPKSAARIGFLAYINLTLPPQRQITAKEPLVAYLAAIDTDPNHPFSDPRWSWRQDYLGALRGWTRAMQGRVVIYDYDQSMLVWRDLPNPSHQVLQAEIKEYARLGILGFGTESRNALATTFLNLYFRGQLYWNPNLDVASELKEFYPRFFGPAAVPMESYWSAIYRSWSQTHVTEHEFFVIPAIYPRELVERLGEDLARTRGVQEQPYRARLDFVQRSWGILDGYTRMLSEVSQGNYGAAVKAGEEALAVREQLTASGGIFTTYKNFPETGPAFWPGEVELLRKLATFVRKRIRQSPVLWDYRPDPDDHGIWQDWAGQQAGPWTPVRTDLYLQAQLPETRPGFGWFRWNVTLKAEELAGLRLYFPGLLSESWLYVNGKLVEHRPQKELWWLNDYAFSWDAPLQGLHPGVNSLVVRTRVPLHLAGMFRPPFLYIP
ncbi:MAG: DUF4838 domain-containing protein [Candidatus Eremiobacteraeota bacterium]|nr:DUF4838 domain-containing protein [Candidatus Eremiobacteraeota bacterium]